MVVFDSTVLMLLIRPESGAALNAADGGPVSRVRDRISYFIEQNERSRIRIGIPTPVLAEVLVRAGSEAVKILEKIKEFAVFEILPFDEVSAIETAFLTREAIDAGDKRSGSAAVWSKVKFDRQILATARVRQATAIYSDDADIRNMATRLGMTVIGIAEMPLPAETAQRLLPFDMVPPETSDKPSFEEIDDAKRAESEHPDT